MEDHFPQLPTIEMEHSQELLDIANRLLLSLAGLHYSGDRGAQAVHLKSARQRYRTLGELLAKAG